MTDATDDMDERLRLVKPDDQAALKPTPYARTPGAAKAVAKSSNKKVLWPSLADPYQAAGSADNDVVARLVVVMGHARFKPGGGPAYYTLQYAYIGMGEYGYEADGQSFRIPFHEPKGSKLLLAYGRNILLAGDYISLRRMPWIRVADRDFRPGDDVPDDEPIFLHIEVADMPD